MTSARWAWLAFGAIALVAAGILLHLGRDLTFVFDEWDWILRRREPSLDALLQPNNEHLSIVPVALYEILLKAFGLRHYEAFRVLGLSAHVAVCALVFVYLVRRVMPVVAVAGAAVLLFYGAAWYDILWPFQHAWLLSVGAGVGAFLLLDVDTRRADAGASLAVAVSLASSGIGIPVAAGVTADLVLRRRWSRLWVVGVPLAAYALWYVGYSDARSRVDGPLELVRYVVEAAGAVIGSLVGVGSAAGQALLLLLVPAFVVTVVRAGPERRARLLGLVAVPVTFWVLIAIGRAGFQPPDASRYVYPPAAFVVLVAAECVRTVRWRTLAVVATVAVALWSLAWNSSELIDGRDTLLEASNFARVDLGAVRAGVDEVPSWYRVERPAIPEVMRRYAEAFDELGSPVATLSALARSPAASRVRADGFLARAVGLELSDPRPVAGPAPTVLGGATALDGSCVLVGADGSPVDAQVEAASRGLLIESEGDRPVDVSARNLADRADDAAIGVVPASRARTLLVPAVGGRRWTVTVRSEGAVRLCAVGGDARTSA